MALALRLLTLSRLGLKTRAHTATSRYLSFSVSRFGTIIPYKLTDIGEGIRDVVVKEWYVKPGDRVSQFDQICEVQSDKASVTITSRYDGTIKTLRYKVDDVALVGDPLVDIEIDEEEPATIDVGRPSDERLTEKKLRCDKSIATPAVRRIAMENDIDLKEVPATGKGGRVLKEDIVAHLRGPSAAATAVMRATSSATSATATSTTAAKEMKSSGGKRYTKHMWKSMTQSLTIPHFVYSDECDVTKLVRCRNELKNGLMEHGISLSLMPFFIKATSLALEKIPELNALIDQEKQAARIMDNHNISVAMDTPEGLVVPNVKNVQTLDIVAIARELNRLQELGKKAAIPLEDLNDGTFSLSNIGVVGGTYTKPVILPPQVVIGALGRVRKLPRLDDDEKVFAANIICVSWAADHRVVDGVTMAKYSNLWKYYVENPTHLLLGI